MVLPCLCIFPPVIGKFYGYARVNLCRLDGQEDIFERQCWCRDKRHVVNFNTISSGGF